MLKTFNCEIASVFTLGFGFVVAATAARPIVDLGYASYQGISDPSLGIDYYKGLYFAAPPTGANRWRAPLDIEENNNYTYGELIDASNFGPQCVQGVPPWVVPTLFAELELDVPALATSSENCLLLDVITPSAPQSAALPVIVQIHGGGFTIGNSSLYAGPYVVQHSDGGVIYVQIQYRLGAYGFLSGPEVLADGTANAGLLDQNAALGWVQRNIAKFGGDPNKVTIWGGSAGGGSVLAQLILYGGVSDPPYRAAIAEYPAEQPFHNETTLTAQYNDLLATAKCTDLACLRGLSYDALAAATQSVYAYGQAQYGPADFWFGPSVDGTVIKGLPTEEFRNGHFSRVPLLIDHDGFEGVALTNLTITTMSEVTNDLKQTFPAATTSFLAALNKLTATVEYLASLSPGLLSNSQFWRLQQIVGDAIFACPTYWVATATNAVSLPTWKLIFDSGTELHGATMPFLLDPANETSNATQSTYMKDYWLSFAINLDPNVGTFSNLSRPYWPQYLSEKYTLVFNQTNVGVQADVDDNARCNYLYTQSEIILN